MNNLESGLQEATLAVAEVERKKREKRKRQALRIKGRNGNQLVFQIWFDILSPLSWES